MVSNCADSINSILTTSAVLRLRISHFNFQTSLPILYKALDNNDDDLGIAYDCDDHDSDLDFGRILAKNKFIISMLSLSNGEILK